VGCDLNGGYERVTSARVSTEIRTCTPEVTGDQVFVAVIASVWGFVYEEMNEFALIDDVTNNKFSLKTWILFLDQLVTSFLNQENKGNAKRVCRD
jgi:hypothetical protein